MVEVRVGRFVGAVYDRPTPLARRRSAQYLFILSEKAFLCAAVNLRPRRGGLAFARRRGRRGALAVSAVPVS